MASFQGGGGGSPQPFLNKTYDMVSDPETDDIVSWNQDGKSFTIWKTMEFARDVLPKYFKHNNFCSFVRQLNTYRFRKSSPDEQRFENELFIKGRRELLTGITRRTASSSRAKPEPGDVEQMAGPLSQHDRFQKSGLDRSRVLGEVIEVGQYGTPDEAASLKRDGQLIMAELVRLRQIQKVDDNRIRYLSSQLQKAEDRVDALMEFLMITLKNGHLSQGMSDAANEFFRIGELMSDRDYKRPRNSVDVCVPQEQEIVLHQSQVPSRHDMENRKQDLPGQASTSSIVDKFSRWGSGELRRSSFDNSGVSSVTHDDLVITQLDDSAPEDRTSPLQSTAVSLASHKPVMALPVSARTSEDAGFSYLGSGGSCGQQQPMAQPMVFLPDDDVGASTQGGMRGVYKGFGRGYGQDNSWHQAHGHGANGMQFPEQASTSMLYDIANEGFIDIGNADIPTELVPFNEDEYIRWVPSQEHQLRGA